MFFPNEVYNNTKGSDTIFYDHWLLNKEGCNQQLTRRQISNQIYNIVILPLL